MNFIIRAEAVVHLIADKFTLSGNGDLVFHKDDKPVGAFTAGHWLEVHECDVEWKPIHITNGG